MKKIKSFISIMLVAVMALAMSMTAFAANGDYTLTIATVKNHTYKIYQLATGDVSADGTKLSNIEVGKAAKSGTQVSAIEALANISGGEEDISDAAWALINSDATEGVYTIEGGEKGGEKTTSLPGGYYVIEDTFTSGTQVAEGDTLSRFIVKLVADQKVNPKVTTVTPDKKIVEDGDEVEDSEASIGDTITYRLKGNLPDMIGYKSMKFVFVDTMSKGLTPNLTKNQTLIGTVGTNNKAEFTVTDIINNSNGTTTVRIALNKAFSYKETQNGANVSVDITATLNKEAEVVDKDNPNSMKIEFNNIPNYIPEGTPGDDFNPDEPRGTTADKTVQTYTTSLTINKTDATDNQPLTGAEFQLTSNNSEHVGYVTGQEYIESRPSDYTGKEWYKLVDGAYTTTAPTDTTANKYADTNKVYYLVDVNKTTYTAAQTNARAFVDAKGKVVFTGLGVGNYTLTETIAPDGYNKIEPIDFTVSWTKENGFTVQVTSGNGTITVDSEGIGLLGSTIPNAQGTLLPSTGGIGTTIFYIVGAILVIGAGIILVAKKRMSHEQ